MAYLDTRSYNYYYTIYLNNNITITAIFNKLL